MKWTRNIAGIFAANTADSAYQAAMAAGRTAVLQEDDAAAAEHFARAADLARAANLHALVVDAALAHAESLIRMGRADAAAALIDAHYKTAENDAQLGVIVLTRGNWAAAQGDSPRADYELALRHARNVKAEGLEGRVLGALGDMYLAEGNASYAVRLLRDAVSKLNAAADVDNSSHAVGLLGQALVESGQEVEGQHLLERALNLARNTNNRRNERHWSGVLGKRAAREGRFHDAKDLYLRALALFRADAQHADFVLMLCEMSQVCLSLRDTQGALGYARTAVSTAETLGKPEIVRTARGALGVALRVAGSYADAIPHLEAASMGEGAPIDLLRSLAAAQAKSGATDAAIQTYARAIKAAEKSPLALAQTRRDLGLTHQALGDLHAAIHEWMIALAIYETEKAAAQAARLLCDIANARKVSGQHARAMKDFEDALLQLNAVEESDLETRGLVLSNAANAYADSGDVESADSFFNEAITIANRLEDRAAESTRSGNYGWFLLHVGRPRRAISVIERALQLSRELDMPLHTAVQTDNLGLVYDALGDYMTALDHHRQALRLLEALDQPYWVATARINQANTLIALAQIDQAGALLDAALATGRALGRVELVIAALIGLASVALGQRDLDGAENLLHEAITLARKHDMRRLLAEALSVRSHQQALANQPADAAATWEEAHKLYAMLHMAQAKVQPAWLVGESRKG